MHQRKYRKPQQNSPNKDGTQPYIQQPKRTKARWGGVGFLWKSNTDIAKPPQQLWPGRLATLTIRSNIFGLLRIYNIYGYTAQGISADNMELLTCLFKHVATSLHPYIIAGDWNIPAQAMQHYVYHNTTPIHLHIPNIPTNYPSPPAQPNTLDYFATHQIINELQPTTWVDTTTTLPTHRPVHLTLKAATTHQTITVTKRKQKLPTTPVSGPQKPLSDLSLIHI